ncbi:hypothetical protein CAOG_008579 [Capsaspora owczarzaki ATCC 30864]|uniref:Deacetylase sirtuin-type domain-containing protein n=2 Tax=Capsaspora owczarzaki (strain ATCC 30864) TaxID=595528 RepID=A0A0D2VL79_CAPO3|nr:hypothetical protein CAOG_008579 [Capsaspora owczarzaki ATCC 30864]
MPRSLPNSLPSHLHESHTSTAGRLPKPNKVPSRFVATSVITTGSAAVAAAASWQQRRSAFGQAHLTRTRGLSSVAGLAFTYNSMSSNATDAKQQQVERLPLMTLDPTKTMPQSARATDEQIQQLAEFIEQAPKIVVLTGAGISTESGVPDYRSPGVGLYVTSSHKPTQFREFVMSETKRRRYWARNYAAFPSFAQTRPNISHDVLARLEETGKINFIITQNVDSLHSHAGSKHVLELHGNGSEVVCLSCRDRTRRSDLQVVLERLNAEWSATITGFTPDGDVNLVDAGSIYSSFQFPDCSKCGGLLKPDVVFFGENVPAETVELARQKIRDADALLVVGSSLTVFSGFRFAKYAQELGKPIGIINIGATRADDIATFKIESHIGDVLWRTYQQLQL